MADDTILVDILTDVKSSISSIVKYTAAIGGATIAIKKVIDMGSKWSKAASDAEEIASKYGVVFKDMGVKASYAAKSLADNYDLADSTAQKLLSTTGDLLTGFGFSRDATLDLSLQVNSLAADLASFTNYEGGAEGAGMALTKAMLGETESAKSLGIVINKNNERYKELIRHYVDSEGLTEQQAKAYAALTMATEQSKNAVGDYARTSDSSTNVIKRYGEVQKELNEELGKMALDVGIPVIKFMSDYIAKITSAMQGSRQLSNFFEKGITPDSMEEINVLIDETRKKIQGLYGVISKGNAPERTRKAYSEQLANLDKLTQRRKALLDEEATAEQNRRKEEEEKRRAAEEKRLAEMLAAEQAYFEASLQANAAYWNAKTEEESIWQDALKERDERERESAAYEIEMQRQRLEAATTFFSGWAALAELGAEKSFALAVAFKALASAEAAINSYLAFTKALASAPWPFNIAAASGVLAAGLAQQIKINSTPMPKFAQGGDFVTSGPQAIMVGDNATGRERVKVEPLGASSEGNRTLIIPITLNGRELGRAITIMSNDGRIITNSRSVR